MNLLLNKLCFQPLKGTYNLSLPGLQILTDEKVGTIVMRNYMLPWKARTLIVFQDLNEDVGSWDVDHYARELNCHMVVIEYPGYGLCPGVATELTIHKYVLRVYEILKESSDIVLLGNGWGCYFSCFLAHYLTKRQIFVPMILLNPHMYYSWFHPWVGNVLNIKRIAPNILSDVLYIHGKQNKYNSLEEAYGLSKLFPYLFKLYILERGDYDIAHTTTVFYHIKNFLSFHPTSLR